MLITVRRDVNQLTDEEWVFTFWENRSELRLSSYSKWQRSSTRHKKHLRKAWWDFLRQADHQREPTRLDRAAVPWDDNLAREALQFFMSSIRVVPPSEAP